MSESKSERGRSTSEGVSALARGQVEGEGVGEGDLCTVDDDVDAGDNRASGPDMTIPDDSGDDVVVSGGGGVRKLRAPRLKNTESDRFRDGVGDDGREGTGDGEGKGGGEAVTERAVEGDEGSGGSEGVGDGDEMRRGASEKTVCRNDLTPKRMLLMRLLALEVREFHVEEEKGAGSVISRNDLGEARLSMDGLGDGLRSLSELSRSDSGSDALIKGGVGVRQTMLFRASSDARFSSSPMMKFRLSTAEFDTGIEGGSCLEASGIVNSDDGEYVKSGSKSVA
ncbi:hypothetical protein HK102_002794 [Quaeritorhiza haematococci]|nr:hypothetical protein HK102_002794 [Quaeritorhiza haematococci]